jgi:small subunit ribosomal protein S15
MSLRPLAASAASSIQCQLRTKVSVTAIRRRKANIQRQAELREQRLPTNFDPIVGKATPFTEGLLTPDKIWTNVSINPELTGSETLEGEADTSAVQAKPSDALYFRKRELSKVQQAVLQASLNREQANPSPPAKSLLPPSPQGDSGTSNYGSLWNQGRAADLEQRNTQKSQASSRIVALQNANARTLRAYNTAQAVKTFARQEGDTGTPEVQAAVLTVRILALQSHMQGHKKDKHSYRGFRGLVHKRQTILAYLRRESVERYFACLEKLGLEDQSVTREISM